MSLCLRYTKNEEDAMEALNTGFYKVFKNIRQYEASKATVFTWMRTIIINSCLDISKAKEKIPEARELDRATEVSIAPDILSKINSEQILILVRTLPPATQAVFNLYVMEGYNHAETGKILNISEGTSKWHLSEARRTLQKKINEHQLK